MFDRLAEAIDNISEETSKIEGEAQEGLADKLDSVATAVADLRDHVSKTSPRRFRHSGHKL